jgi:hypothetical protein
LGVNRTSMHSTFPRVCFLCPEARACLRTSKIKLGLSISRYVVYIFTGAKGRKSPLPNDFIGEATVGGAGSVIQIVSKLCTSVLRLYKGRWSLVTLLLIGTIGAATLWLLAYRYPHVESSLRVFTKDTDCIVPRPPSRLGENFDNDLTKGVGQFLINTSAVLYGAATPHRLSSFRD